MIKVLTQTVAQHRQCNQLWLLKKPSLQRHPLIDLHTTPQTVIQFRKRKKGTTPPPRRKSQVFALTSKFNCPMCFRHHSYYQDHIDSSAWCVVCFESVSMRVWVWWGSVKLVSYTLIETVEDQYYPSSMGSACEGAEMETWLHFSKTGARSSCLGQMGR